MSVNLTGSAANTHRSITPDNTEVQHAPAPPPLQGELGASRTAAGAPVRTVLSPSASSEISTRVNVVVDLLDSGGAQLLVEGAQNGFQRLPVEYRALAMQTARMAGLVDDSPPAGSHLPFSEIKENLKFLVSDSAKLLDATKLTLGDALALDPQQRATALLHRLQTFNDTGRLTAAAIAQKPVAELCEHRDVVKPQLRQWMLTTEALHEQLKAQLDNAMDPVVVAAQEARSQASAIFSKTIFRMAVANAPAALFNATVGPVLSTLARFFGGGA